MKIVVQRVLRSSVSVGGEVIGEIGRGLMVLFGAEKGDGDSAVDALAEKVLHLIGGDEDRRRGFPVRRIVSAGHALDQLGVEVPHLEARDGA